MKTRRDLPGHRQAVRRRPSHPRAPVDRQGARGLAQHLPCSGQHGFAARGVGRHRALARLHRRPDHAALAHRRDIGARPAHDVIDQLLAHQTDLTANGRDAGDGRARFGRQALQSRVGARGQDQMIGAHGARRRLDPPAERVRGHAQRPRLDHGQSLRQRLQRLRRIDLRILMCRQARRVGVILMLKAQRLHPRRQFGDVAAAPFRQIAIQPHARRLCEGGPQVARATQHLRRLGRQIVDGAFHGRRDHACRYRRSIDAAGVYHRNAASASSQLRRRAQAQRARADDHDVEGRFGRIKKGHGMSFDLPRPDFNR